MRVTVDRSYEPAALAGALVSLEADFTERRPDAVVAADDSDAALAAALVATKLLIPFEATEAATTAPTANGRVLAQLAAVPA